MTAREEKMVNNTIEEIVMTVASRNNIDVVKRSGTMLVAKEDEENLIKALDVYLKDYKVQ